MTTLSPLRTGRVTGSRVGAILGLSNYQTRADVLRAMVREHHGAPAEFVGNDATRWGQDHEADALTAYEQDRGVLIHSAQQFVIHPEHQGFGVSPDGLIGTDGAVEAKCPMRAQYTSIGQKPEYGAQVQLLLACTGRAWTDFIIWRSYGQADRLGVEPLIVERVEADPGWLPLYLPDLELFLAEYEATVADPELSAPHLASREREDDAWRYAADNWRAAHRAKELADARLEDARDALIALGAGSGLGVSVTSTARTGSVDWRKAVEKYAPDVDVEPFRKPGITAWAIKETTA